MSTSLIDTQVVQVAWTGFRPGSFANIHQCKATVAALADCVVTPEASVTGVTTRADGTGATLFRVRAGDGAPTLLCSDKQACSVGVFEVDDTGAEDVSRAAFTPAKFAPTPDSCPTGGPPLLAGSGASSANAAMLSWAARLCRPPTSNPIDFSRTTSPDGRSDFLRGLVSVGLTSDPASAQELGKDGGIARAHAYAPATVSGLAFIYNIKNPRTGAQITDLKLTPALLAKIFTNKLDNWQDPEVAKLNPDLRLPTFVRPVLRAEHSADTLLLTSYFAATAKEVYAAGGAAFKDAPVTDTYPAVENGVLLRTGPTAVANEVFLAAGNPQQFGFIGAVDSSVAALIGLPTVKVQNRAGEFVGPTDASLLAAVPGMAPHAATGTRRADVAGTVKGIDPATAKAAYPLPRITYLMVPTAEQDTALRQRIADTLAYVAADGQGVEGTDRALPRGYLPLPDLLRRQTLEARAKVIAAKGTPSGSVGPLAPRPAASVAPVRRSSPAPSPAPSRFAAPAPVRPPAPPAAPAPATDALAAAFTPPVTVAPAPVIEAALSVPVAVLEIDDASLLLPTLALIAVLALLAGPSLWLGPMVGRRVRVRRRIKAA